MPLPDPFQLQRFVTAQADDYARALAELRAGKKKTHWIWFVLPQLRGLGTSPMAHEYGISGLAEAHAYLAHPLLGPRLRECVEALLAHADTPIETILGPVDALKFRSCLTLFHAVADDKTLFHRALDAFYNGEPDPRTLAILSGNHP